MSCGEWGICCVHMLVYPYNTTHPHPHTHKQLHTTIHIPIQSPIHPYTHPYTHIHLLFHPFLYPTVSLVPPMHMSSHHWGAVHAPGCVLGVGVGVNQVRVKVWVWGCCTHVLYPCCTHTSIYQYLPPHTMYSKSHTNTPQNTIYYILYNIIYYIILYNILYNIHTKQYTIYSHNVHVPCVLQWPFQSRQFLHKVLCCLEEY